MGLKKLIKKSGIGKVVTKAADVTKAGVTGIVTGFVTGGPVGAIAGGVTAGSIQAVKSSRTSKRTSSSKLFSNAAGQGAIAGVGASLTSSILSRAGTVKTAGTFSKIKGFQGLTKVGASKLGTLAAGAGSLFKSSKVREAVTDAADSLKDKMPGAGVDATPGIVADATGEPDPTFGGDPADRKSYMSGADVGGFFADNKPLVYGALAVAAFFGASVLLKHPRKS